MTNKLLEQIRFTVYRSKKPTPENNCFLQCLFIDTGWKNCKLKPIRSVLDDIIQIHSEHLHYFRPEL